MFGFMIQRERVNWIDVAKFLGMFAIYIGHFGQAAGLAKPFVFTYHVPLFFFLSGCMNYYDKEKNILKYILKKLKTIMVPLWAFSLLSIIIWIIQNPNGTGIKNMLMLVLKGNVRNTFFAGALWFLTCLFVIEIIFKILKYLKLRCLIVGVCLFLFWVSEKVIDPRPIVTPHWYYNLDSALYYCIFFALGYVIYPYALRLFRLDNKAKRIIFIVTGIISLCYSAMVFKGIDVLEVGMIQKVSFIYTFIPILRAVAIIWCNLTVSKIFEDIKLFRAIGKESLYLCGNEYIIKTIVPSILNMIGLSCQLGGISTYIYTLFLLIVCTKALIPCEKRFVRSFCSFLKQNFLCQYGKSGG